MINIPFMDKMPWVRKKASNAFSEFATKGFAEALKQGMTILATGFTHSTVFGTIVGMSMKGLADSLFTKASKIDAKLDLLVKEPLISGVILLRQAISHSSEQDNERSARNALLDAAHIAFTRALAFSIDSQEDRVFISALDCICLACHEGHQSIVKGMLESLDCEIEQQRSKVILLKEQAYNDVEYAKVYESFIVGNDKYRDKPLAYVSLRLAGKNLAYSASKIETKANESDEKLQILMDMSSFAKQIVRTT